MEPDDVAMRELTTEELVSEADDLARRVGLTRAEAFERLDAGEYRGTIFESKMAAIRFLLTAEPATLSSYEGTYEPRFKR